MLFLVSLKLFYLPIIHLLTKKMFNLILPIYYNTGFSAGFQKYICTKKQNNGISKFKFNKFS